MLERHHVDAGEDWQWRLKHCNNYGTAEKPSTDFEYEDIQTFYARKDELILQAPPSYEDEFRGISRLMVMEESGLLLVTRLILRRSHSGGERVWKLDYSCAEYENILMDQ